MDLSTLPFGTGGGGTGGSGDAAALSAISGLTQILGGVAANERAKSNAELLEKLGLLSAEEERRLGRELEGAQRARATTPGFGSALDIIAADAVETELAALVSKFGFDARANAQEFEGRTELLSGITRGTNTILGGFQRSINQSASQRTP